MPDLDALLEFLNPENITRQIGLNHDIARERYPTQMMLDSELAFRAEMTRYVKQQYAIGFRLPGMPDELAEDPVFRILESAFERFGGYLGAVEYARVYGLRRVYEELYERLKREHENLYRATIKRRFIGVSLDDRVNFARQYLQRYGRFRSPGTPLPSPERLALNIDKWIDFQLDLIYSMRFTFLA